jgi:hypothetical protein
VGFLSFLAYRIYGYLDSWHGVATAALLPLLLGGGQGYTGFAEQRGLAQPAAAR